MSFPNMFTKNAAANMTSINVERTIDGVKDALSMASDAATNRTISGYVYSSESFDEDRYRVVSNTMDQLSESLTSMSAKLGLESYSNSQIKSAVGAAIGAGVGLRRGGPRLSQAQPSLCKLRRSLPPSA